MIARLVYALALGVTLGGITHIATLLAVPTLAPDSAYDRLGRLGADGRFAALPDSGPEADLLPFRDPAFVTAACRFDLAGGPVTIRAALPPGYGAMSVHNRSGQPFYTLNDRAATRGAVEVTILSKDDLASAESVDAPDARPGLRIVSPSTTGFVLVRLFVEAASARPGLRALAETASCGRAATRRLSP